MRAGGMMQTHQLPQPDAAAAAAAAAAIIGGGSACGACWGATHAAL